MLSGFLGTEFAIAAEQLKLAELSRPKPVPVGRVTGAAGSDLNKKDETAGKGRALPDVSWPKDATADIPLDASGKRSGGVTRELGGLPVTVTPVAAGKNATAPSGTVKVRTLDREQLAEETEDAADSLLGLRLDTSQVTGDSGQLKVTLDYSAFKGAFGGDFASRLTLVDLTPQDCEPGKGTRCSGAGAEGDALEGDALEGDALEGVSNDVGESTLTAEVPLPARDSAPPAGQTGKSEKGEKGSKDKQGEKKDEKSEQADKSSKSATLRSAAQPAAAPVVLGVRAEASGANGTFKASSLSKSGSWQAGGSSGAFTWGYDIEVPQVPGNLAPELSLGYSSQAVDGRTAATNNQANWVGDGWALTENYVERRYVSCSEDKGDGAVNKTDTGDLCWRSDNAVVSLDGETNELVRDDKSGDWKLQDDDGTKIERLTDTARGNGDNDGEYWKITTTDGTQYFFGYNRLPGWSAGKPETKSTWTAPVYGNHKDEPCHKASFADAHCTQAWRWNLDYVVDTNNNATSYWYEKETNRYARAASPTTGLGTPTAYDRGGYLKRIDYGMRAGALFDANAAAGRVNFTVAERCVPSASFDCAESKFTEANAKHWPDVPFDQHCASGDCKGRAAPTFWTRKHLKSIGTEVLDGASYQKVDTYTLDANFPSTGDGSSPALWLKSIQRTGHTGGEDIALPKITFRGKQLANRVDATGDGIPPLIRYRVHQVDDESGGVTGVTYSEPECTRSALPSETSNTKLCYPVYWVSPDNPGPDYKPVKDWFHKYVATRVTEGDKVGGSPTEQTDYTFLGGAAWAKSEDEFTKPEHRTYADFRGYGHVRTTVGNGTDGARLRSEERYFRGVSGAQVPDDEGRNVADDPVFAGVTRAETAYDGDKIISSETTVPWKSGPTASRARPGLPALQAHQADVKETHSRVAENGGWQRTRSEQTFDAYGMVATVTDHGDTAKSGDETCTVTSYARNTGSHIVDTVASEKTVAGTCAATQDGKSATAADLISEERTYYDGSTTLGAAPTRGDVTRQDENNGAGDGFITVSRTTYDGLGRPLEITDADGGKTVTAYTPSDHRAPTKAVATNPLGHTVTTEIDPRRGVPTAEIDANGKRTDAEYDALGRLTKVWEPGQPKAQHPNLPNASYAYTISQTKPSVVATTLLKGDGSTETGYVIHDGQLRERQTQEPSATGEGRVVTEQHYDSRGLVWKEYDAYYADGSPSGELVTAADTKVPSLTRNVHDAAGRLTDEIHEKYGTEQTRSRTLHDGGRTTVVPPKGGTATTTVTDAHDRTIEQIEYLDEARTKSQSTKYAYDVRGNLAKVTDVAGNEWVHRYDARGRLVEQNDPDTGRTRTTYDDLDRPVTTTDSRGTTLTTRYDELGRRTALKQGDKTLAEWTYDTLAKGEVTRSVRHEGGKAYVQEVTGYTDDYQPRGTKVTIPDGHGAGLAGTYTFGYSYNSRSGALTSIAQPAIGDLPAERVTTRYDASDLPAGLTAGGAVLVNQTTYDPFERALRTEMNTQGKRIYQTSVFDEHTGFVNRVTTDTDKGRVEDRRYTYNDVGNITRISTRTGTEEAPVTDTQCFAMDALQRLTDAWSTTDDCKAPGQGTSGTGDKAQGPSAGKAVLADPEAYWLSYSYDALGNRTKETRHGIDGGDDTVRTYHYGDAKNGEQPNALKEVRTTKGDGKEETTGSYAYDAAGNMTSRKAAGRDQRIEWTAEGEIAKVTEAGGSATSYTYDADGQRQTRTDARGTTLYLPAGNELLLKPDGKKAGTRYYEHNGETVAVRSEGETTFLLADHHGTATTALKADTLESTTRKLLPFGEHRGAQPTHWPGDQGFVGGTEDATGLTQLGARAYDPTIGRFISVDPLVDHGDSQRMNPYAYANNNPVSFEDSDGLFFKKVFKKIKRAVKKTVKKVRAVASKVKAVKAKIKRVQKKIATKIKRVVKNIKKAVKKTVKRVAKRVIKTAKRVSSVKKSQARKGTRTKSQPSKSRVQRTSWRGGSKSTSAKAPRTSMTMASSSSSGPPKPSLQDTAEFLSYRAWINSAESGLNGFRELVSGNYGKAKAYGRDAVSYFVDGTPAAAGGMAGGLLNGGGKHRKPTLTGRLGKIMTKTFGMPVALVATGYDYYKTPPYSGAYENPKETRAPGPLSRRYR